MTGNRRASALPKQGTPLHQYFQQLSSKKDKGEASGLGTIGGLSLSGTGAGGGGSGAGVALGGIGGLGDPQAALARTPDRFSPPTDREKKYAAIHSSKGKPARGGSKPVALAATPKKTTVPQPSLTASDAVPPPEHPKQEPLNVWASKLDYYKKGTGAKYDHWFADAETLTPNSPSESSSGTDVASKPTGRYAPGDPMAWMDPDWMHKK